MNLRIALALLPLVVSSLAGQVPINAIPRPAQAPQDWLVDPADMEFARRPQTRTGTDSLSTAYGGYVQFAHVVIGEFGTSIEAATVFVKGGKAICSGSMQDGENGYSLNGDGLFHVTFKSWEDHIADAEPPSREDRPITKRELNAWRDSLRRAHGPDDSGYSFFVACPTTRSAASDENPFDTYFQDGGLRWDAQNNRPILPDSLQGGWTIPAPETDNLNGVSGSLSMVWKLCLGCEVKINTRRHQSRPPPPDPPLF